MNKEAKISCKNIWKLYGEAPEKFLKNTNNNPTTEEIKKNNLNWEENLEITVLQIQVLTVVKNTNMTQLVIS